LIERPGLRGSRARRSPRAGRVAAAGGRASQAARCREVGVALPMLVPEAEHDHRLPPRATTRCWITPDAAVRRCRQCCCSCACCPRRSWLTVEGGRQAAASPGRTGSRGRVGRRGCWRSVAGAVPAVGETPALVGEHHRPVLAAGEVDRRRVSSWPAQRLLLVSGGGESRAVQCEMTARVLLRSQLRKGSPGSGPALPGGRVRR
jgi:hypothetical protein